MGDWLKPRTDQESSGDPAQAGSPRSRPARSWQEAVLGQVALKKEPG